MAFHSNLPICGLSCYIRQRFKAKRQFCLMWWPPSAGVVVRSSSSITKWAVQISRERFNIESLNFTWTCITTCCTATPFMVLTNKSALKIWPTATNRAKLAKLCIDRYWQVRVFEWRNDLPIIFSSWIRIIRLLENVSGISAAFVPQFVSFSCLFVFDTRFFAFDDHLVNFWSDATHLMQLTSDI